MKRSEMVKLLNESYIKHVNSYESYDDTEVFSRILKDLEKAGMKPPKYTKLRIRENSAGQYLDSEYVTLENWEEE